MTRKSLYSAVPPATEPGATEPGATEPRARERRAAESRADASYSPKSRSAQLCRSNSSAEIAQASRALLAELEASLEASQRALLGRDVASLEQCTSEQARLQRSLEILWSAGAAHLPGSNSPKSDAASDIPAFNVPAFDIPAFDAELRAAQRRVLHLGRIQTALLGRAQRWLRTVSHLLAGLDQSYSFSASSQVPQYSASPTRIGPGVSRHTKEVGPEEKDKDKEGDPCRA
jgi:hypothetical protein